VYDLEDTASYADSNVSLRDLGKKVYLGLVNGESRIFTYNLVRIEQGSHLLKSFYVLTATNSVTSAISTELDGYGEVYVGRGAA